MFTYLWEKREWSLLFRTAKPRNDVFHNAVERPSSGWCCRWPQPEQTPTSAFQKPGKTEGDHSVAQVGREPQAWSALSSDPGCSGPCPVEFWNLPRTESAQQLWANRVTAYAWESFSWYKVGTSRLSVYGLCCSCRALPKSLLALGDPRMHIGRQVMGPLRGHLFPGLHFFTPAPLPQPLFLGQEQQPPSILRPYAQLVPVYQHLLCVEGAQNWTEYLDVARWMARKVG